ncbi:4Fe-4S dicluster domain-containing protein [Treponema brennaborense]|uniref:4Fe-4S ferredoxin iron-sulfur binding domain-containing protein n=1 Tax=Treponema brennaborense (strain DSM 12168 / CIP 105900 / DD5/3) TaxID=906968 RepID=F4LMQ5_TREBD|nr:4Fe-4S dicluster domain-containing protein [Treponema brennaborense]AEE16802.1 4Fe-4S ferredoxin iron-sulfur binding domain-containing protein [Treponema brennaborense DSM 12168]
MILTVVFLVLFLIAAGMLIIFVYSVLIPSVTGAESRKPVHAYVFADSELKYASRLPAVCEDGGFRAVIRCNPAKTDEQRRFAYDGPRDCRLFDSLYQTEFDCTRRCTGFGSCVGSCPQQAIRIINGTAAIAKGCTGCGKCVSACPKQLIELVPAVQAAAPGTCAAENEDTRCSLYQKDEKNVIPARKSFKFWQR